MLDMCISCVWMESIYKVCEGVYILCDGVYIVWKGVYIVWEVWYKLLGDLVHSMERFIHSMVGCKYIHRVAR